MSRKLRYFPQPYALVMTTTRVLHGRFLLTPSTKLNSLIVGVLARAQRLAGMQVCYFNVQSNHDHLLLRPRDAEQLSRFMTFANSNIAREAGRFHGWPGEKFWGRRYADSTVSHEPEAQILELAYCLAQGCKDGLVASPRHWPGATATAALTTGERVTGTWINRSAQYRAHLRGGSTDDALFASAETLELSPIPCWEHLPDEERRTLARRLVREIEEETETMLDGRPPLGRDAILAQDPMDTPKTFKRSPAPRFHAVRPEVRRTMESAYRNFRLEFQQAAQNRRLGRLPTYPPGSFPGPGLFVPLAAPT